MGIRCYQCSSAEDKKGEDSCGVYGAFDPNKNQPVECNSDESVTPGTFCVKIVKQSPRGFVCKQLLIPRFFHYSTIPLSPSYELTHVLFFVFKIGDGRWRQVIRRCGSVSDIGVTGVCNWGLDENSVYWEECYCSEDACNGSTVLRFSALLGLLPLLALFLAR